MNLVFDIEANGLNPDKIFCVVAQEIESKKVYAFGEESVAEGLEFLSKATKLIGHNILGYDLPVILKLHDLNLYDKVILDTLVLSRLFKPTREGGHGLESWGYRLNFIKGSYGKEEDSWDSFCLEMLEYCIRDVELNLKVYEHLRLQESKGFSRESVALEHNVAKIIAQQRDNGFKLDLKKASLLVAELEDKLFSIEEKVHKTFKPKKIYSTLYPRFNKPKNKNTFGEVAKTASTEEGVGVRLTSEEYDLMVKGEEVIRCVKVPFNLGSRKQIGEYLIDFGWKPTKFTPTGQPIVDEGTLSKVKNIPEASMIAEYLMLQKRIAQVKSWIKEVDQDTGRVHGYCNSNGAVTSRMTHSHPNMAQIPASYSPYGKECRECWIVSKGYKLVGIDASGLELRMLAHEMNDKEYVNEILNGDIHTVNQKLIGLESRNQAKTWFYALCYGAGDAKLGSVVGRGRGAGKELRERFFTGMPSFKAVKDRITREASAGYVKTLDGRKLFCRSEHSAFNTKLQGAGAIVMKEALVIFDKKIKDKNLDAKFVANVHDEWQLEVREDQADLVGQLGVQAIREATCSLKLNCPLDGEYNVGRNWSETH